MAIDRTVQKSGVQHMSIITHGPAYEPDRSDRGGIYDLPLIGRPLSDVRDFYDSMEPKPEDSLGVGLGKNVVRYGTVVAAGVGAVGVAAIVCL